MFENTFSYQLRYIGSILHFRYTNRNFGYNFEKPRFFSWQIYKDKNTTQRKREY